MSGFVSLRANCDITVLYMNYNININFIIKLIQTVQIYFTLGIIKDNTTKVNGGGLRGGGEGRGLHPTEHDTLCYI